MNRRWPALAVALLAIALVVAQDAFPATALYHTWQYALALAVALALIVAYAGGARRDRDARAKRLIVALAGAAIVDLAGLAAGLLGPDTATIVGTPGTVVPIPALGAAASFAPADPQTLERGTANVTLHWRDRSSTELRPSSRRIVGETLLYLEQRPAAYVETFDAQGAHLTMTQPTNASFLSPILLFRDRQRIAAFDLPFDTFAMPAKHRVVRALYITADQLTRFGHARVAAGASGPAIILSAADDRGTSLGIAIAASGQSVDIAGIRVRVTIGSYPALAVAAAPLTWLLVLGAVLFVGGSVWAFMPGKVPTQS